MKPAPRRWELSAVEGLPGFPPVLGQLLAARGLSAEHTSAGDELHSPWGLLGMEAAVDCIATTAAEGKPIAIYGDYDTDGVTACALLTLAFRRGGLAVVHHIPNRLADGYGLHLEALQALHGEGVGCVVTVDCGTANIEAAAQRPKDLRLVITDHHLPKSIDGKIELAPADALVNPQQPDCTYPFKGLAGAGVAFKLVQALEEREVLPGGTADSVIGLAAMGTVADMMPLLGENRWLVQRGLRALNATEGLQALCRVASAKSPARASDVAFGIAPRINAAGRMDDALLALQLCLCDDAAQAEQLATQLDAKNKERQAAVAIAMEQAEQAVAELPEDDAAIVLGDQAWSPGIVGLVAGRLSERYARPTFVAALGEEEAKGSARTASGLHLVSILDACAETMIRYGGHAAAAGFTLAPDRFEEFAAAVKDEVKVQMNGRERERVFPVDAVITCADLGPGLADQLETLEPCGQGNPGAVLMIQDAKVLTTATFGAGDAHLRMTISDGSGICEAIAFFKGKSAPHLPRGRRIDICGSLDRDEWQGQQRFRLHVRDVRPAQAVEVRGLEVGTEETVEVRGRKVGAPITAKGSSRG